MASWVWNMSALGVALAASGCGADVRKSCENACERVQDCGNQTASCDELCDEAVEVAEDFDCTSETASFYDCVAASSECGEDIFDGDVCQEEYKELFSCALDYCINNLSDPACTGDPEGGEGGGTSG